MKKYLLILTISILIGATISLSGCKKNEEDPIEQSYELRFSNTSDNPYLVEIDGNSNILSGNTFRNYNLTKGTYAWKVTQQSGYLLFPTIQEGTITMDREREIVFP
jgi:hypothetical protein